MVMSCLSAQAVLKSQKKGKGLRLLCTPQALYTCCSLHAKPGMAGAPPSCTD